MTKRTQFQAIYKENYSPAHTILGPKYVKCRLRRVLQKECVFQNLRKFFWK